MSSRAAMKQRNQPSAEKQSHRADGIGTGPLKRDDRRTDRQKTPSQYATHEETGEVCSDIDPLAFYPQKGQEHDTCGERDPSTQTAVPARLKPIAVEVYQGGQANDFRARAPADVAHEEWRQRLQQALGSFSSHFIEVCLYRLLAACRLPGHGIPTSTSISAAIALIESLDPMNEIQAALAVQIACLDAACSNMLARLASGGPESRAKLTLKIVSRSVV
jgi:hypothetical protein